MTTENSALMEALEDFCKSAECAAGCDEGVTEDQAYSDILSHAGSAMASSYANARKALSRPTQPSGDDLAKAIGKLLGYDPICCGRVSMGTIMQIMHLIDPATRPAPLPAERKADGEELSALRSALKNLLDACYQADGAENLPEEIDGSLLDAAAEALELQYPIIWTPEQVAILQERQADGAKHPYTCGGDRSDRAHLWHADEACEEPGLLYPTERGWKCPACDYRQFWSHETGGAAALAPAQPVSEQGEGLEPIGIVPGASKGSS